MEPESNKAKRDDAEEPSSVRLGQQEQERPTKALDLARGVMESSLEEEPTDHQERDTPSRHAEPAEPDGDLSFGLGHLTGFQILRERGPVRLDELPDADDYGDDAEQFGDEATARIREQGGHRFLGAVVRR